MRIVDFGMRATALMVLAACAPLKEAAYTVSPQQARALYRPPNQPASPAYSPPAVVGSAVVSNPARPPVATGGNEVQLVKEGGTFKVPVTINGALTLGFIVDSGASDVSIPEDVVSTLIRTGTISESDFLGEQTYRLADGSKVKSKTFRIRQLTVGNRTVNNVMGSVAGVKGSLLLGQSFLSRFSSVKFDYGRNVLVLE